jgi:hypothetical protein
MNDPYRESIRLEAINQIDTIDEVTKATGETEESKEFFKNIVLPMAEVVLSLNSITATIQDSYEALSGKSLYDGSELSTFDRSFAILGVVTLGFGSKIGKGLKFMGKVFAKTPMGTKALGMAERVLGTAQRIVGNGKGKLGEFLGNVRAGDWSKVFESTPPSKLLDAPMVQKKLRNDLGIPESWTVKITKSKKPEKGLIFHPEGNTHKNIRLMPGNPNSPHSVSQKPYVIWKENGKTLDVRGNPSTDPNLTHIPLEQFKFLEK